MKARTCAKLGIHSEKHVLPADATQEMVLETVRRLNNQSDIHGILVQSPPPPQIDERTIVETINPAKDVDCFHPTNVGRMHADDADAFVPCTPFGVLVMLHRCGIETSGKRAVVVGRSDIVGKPMAALLARKGPVGNATVTLCHSRTANLAEECRNADILIAAIGRPEIITGDMIKPGAVVIDVGINRVDDASRPRGYKLVGDVDFDAAAEKASWITPVPGGVGPMTIAMLMRNTLDACCRIHGIDSIPPVI
jgi:methylenetetrahydrofolate dehydrogenase (NADP+)/methenyltetrahydrofolate cyclohydrolase